MERKNIATLRKEYMAEQIKLIIWPKILDMLLWNIFVARNAAAAAAATEQQH